MVRLTLALALLGVGVGASDSKPKPFRWPPQGPDSWDRYHDESSGMDVYTVTGGPDIDEYEKVVVMLHGGGGSGGDWINNYNSGWFGDDLTGLKFVFPTSAHPGGTWYDSIKNEESNDCGYDDDCAYNLTSIADSGSRVASLLQTEREREAIGNDAKKVFLGGFSQGAQMTSYVQLANIDYALGGIMILDGYPLPPLVHMPGETKEQVMVNATYAGDDLNMMLYHGELDQVFPLEMTESSYSGIFDALEIEDCLKLNHTEPGMYHTLIESEFAMFIDFVRKS